MTLAPSVNVGVVPEPSPVGDEDAGGAGGEGAVVGEGVEGAAHDLAGATNR